MRKDNRRKSGKRKSVDVDKRSRSRSNSESESAPKSSEVVNGTIVKVELEEESALAVDEDIQTVDDQINETEIECNQTENCEDFDKQKPVLNEKEDSVTEKPESNEDPCPELTKEPVLVNGECSSDKDESNEHLIKSSEKREIRENDREDDLDVEQKRRTNEAALRLYNSLNQLAMQALMNVKQEPPPGSDMQLPEKYMQNILATLNSSYLGLEDAVQDGASLSREDNTLPSHFLRPPPEMSPNAMAKQLRYNDCASMVVCRDNMKGRLGGSDSANSGGLKGGSNANSGLVVSGTGSGLHQFVTRYTIERPDDPSRTGIEVCLTGDDPLDPIIEVECGGNKGLLYVSKLCQGSKGQSILFNDEWLTPNEFQFISGRETAKDWKRSIRHCGKSLKTLMTKGILQVHPPVCECDYCKGQGPATVEKAKKRTFLPTQERQISNSDTMRSGGSTTPSSTESVTPLSAGLSEQPSITLHKPSGREGGLNSIISNLHIKKAICGNDVRTGSGEESLDLRMRATSNTSPAGSANGRKRQRETGQTFSVGSFGENEEHLPMKRRHSNEEGKFPVLGSEASRLDRGQNNRRKSPNNPEPLCLSSMQSEKKQDKDAFYPTISPRREERNGIHEEDRNRDNRSKSYTDSTPPPSSSANSLYSDLCKTARNYPNMPYDHAFLDAMKRAVANVTANAYPDQVRSSPAPPRTSSSGSASLQKGFINLESLSRRLGGASPHTQSKELPMVELTSHRKSNGRLSEHYDYERRNAYDNGESHKAPVTVLHHRPNPFDNSNHRQSNSLPFYGMPPPFFHNSRSRDRYRYGSSPGSSRSERKAGKNKGLSRKHVSDDTFRRRNADMPMLDLHNHAIPMMSLTYSSKKKFEERRNDMKHYNSLRHPNRNSSSLAIQRKTAANQRKAASDDELSRKDDAMRRNSASAPPLPPFSDSAINSSRYLDDNNNEKIKDLKDDVFSRPRAKSASPNAARSHPYLDGPRPHQRSSSSLEGMRPESNFSSFHGSSYDSAPTFMQQYELLRYRDICSAIENMGSWTTEDVCGFLQNIGCEQYQEVFRHNGIDGDALPLLMEHHLVNKMGLKLGHALKVIARVHRRLGNHCAIIGERFGPPQFTPSCRPFFPLMHSISGNSDSNITPLNGFTESPAQPDKEEIV